MKRYFVFGILSLGALILSSVPSYSAEKEDPGEALEEVNAAMGGLAQRVGDIEKVLGLKLSGDIRFRGEYFLQDQDYQPTGITTPARPISDQGRLRFRFRFGAERKFGDHVKGVFRLASGASTDPTSTNQTLTGDFNMKPLLIDQVYIDWSPSVFDKKIKFTMGKIKNPLVKSPITWDDDTNPEGLALGLEPVPGTRLRGNYFVMREIGNSPDPYLLCAQLDQDLKLDPGLDMTLTAGYTWVPNTTTYLSAPPPGFATSGGAGPSVNGNGMVGDASNAGRIPDICMVEGILVLKHKMDGIPLVWTFHGAYNTNSFKINPTSVTASTFKGAGYSASNELALFAQLAAGKVAAGGDLAGSLEYGYIEPNAVFSLFSDSDSGQGYNNNTWFKGTCEVGLEEGLSFKLGQYADWRVNYDVFGGTPNATRGGTSHQPVLRTQADFMMKL